MFGKVGMGVVRCTFIIGEEGMIENVMPRAKPDTNVREALEYLRGSEVFKRVSERKPLLILFSQ
ncbi:MAG: hypothetical protein GX352_06485 [Clostridiales bacterium]|nr:hypothetical protein [Clostridiales bacterium]